MIQFFKVEITKELITWSVGSILFFLAVRMLKIVAWMQMDKSALLGEIKRLPLFVFLSAKKE
ncbi:DUF6768 family protein [Polaribacter sp. SA4-10]|uniref:DUF6768 family protein n=1 Tax=Polaribacter sp. SA4-10 TaxID=754397 RepID=UPI0034A34210